ncbi:class I SAM-dependent methyltransferase [Dictyobacter aurantiacus]|uniref:Methyltransferase domain-containing protein n=1 Tax=Dictyobacter aurantiacus TaxID=1936993 RepID=A0A401ZEG2_9CHLR|nr:class I SAM-dependent methyltransferase [Dictyobacter aurantiacus]GCE05088.1 hypothetical protein KDAU_24170 [Dictyobacter aurantiacus]
MQPKPAHLGLKYAEQFKDSSIVDVYHHRPQHSDEAITVLLSLISDEPRTILDVGCGTGVLARRLVNAVERVDAVDFSQAMLDKGRTLSGGDHPQLNWIYGRMEDITLSPPYTLITAGESLHWMEWEIVMPLFQRVLTLHGYLAIVGCETAPNPWDKDLLALISRFSTNREFQPYDLLEELERRQLFQQAGSRRTRPVLFMQSGEDYIQSIHSRNGFSRERMGEEAASAFDAAARALLTPFMHDGLLPLSSVSEVTWGKPIGAY